MKLTKGFNLGNIYTTDNIARMMEEDINFANHVSRSLMRYISCDWGNMNPQDKKQNDWAVDNNERILAAYVFHDTRYWIITEYDRTTTTILFPYEY